MEWVKVALAALEIDRTEAERVLALTEESLRVAKDAEENAREKVIALEGVKSNLLMLLPASERWGAA